MYDIFAGVLFTVVKWSDIIYLTILKEFLTNDKEKRKKRN